MLCAAPEPAPARNRKSRCRKRAKRRIAGGHARPGSERRRAAGPDNGVRIYPGSGRFTAIPLQKPDQANPPKRRA
jgi:hypothetical protein